MEYVEGVPITTYCTMHALSIPARLRLFRSVCEAVQHAHGHLIVHRDLKPSNIFVRSDGAVKLLDFGISKHLESGGTAADQTRTGLRMMTPAYAAPEQLRGDRIGLHTDVYSLGVVLCELLVGRPPFDLANRSAGEAERIILAGAPERPSVAARRASRDTAAPRRAWADLDVLCLTAMNSDPERRYRTVDALIRDVDHFLDQEPLEARGDNARYRVGKFMTRHWRPLSVGGAVIAAVALLVVFYTLRLRAARNVALAETARVQRIQRFTVDLLEGGDENAGPSDSLRVVTLVDRGVREVRGLNEEPVVQAQLYATLGDISLKLGQLPRADSLFHAALDVQRKTSGADNADVAQTLVGLGMLRSAQAQFGPAEQLVRSGLAMSRRHLPANHPVVLKAATSLGQVIENRGDYKGAITVLDSAVQLQAGSHGVTPELIAMLTELANSEFYAGDYRKSDSLNRVVLAMNRRLYGDRHPLVADILINLGAIQLEWQNYAAAERYYREAIPIVRAWYGDNHPETASDLTMLGRVLVSEKRYGEASALLHQALAIQEHVYGPVHPRVASALNELGRVAQQEGHLDEAQADFERMVSIYRTVYADKHYLIGVALSNLAGVYHDRKNYAQAERLFHDAIRRYQVELPADHQLMGIARVRLGETLVADRKFADAEHELRAGGAILEKQTPPPPLWVERGRNALATAYDSLREPALADSIRSHFLHGSRAVAVASH